MVKAIKTGIWETFIQVAFPFWHEMMKGRKGLTRTHILLHFPKIKFHNFLPMEIYWLQKGTKKSCEIFVKLFTEKIEFPMVPGWGWIERING